MMLPAFTKKSELGISCESREHHGSAEAVLFDRKSTRLNSSHGYISYPVFCLKKKTDDQRSRIAAARERPRLDDELIDEPGRLDAEDDEHLVAHVHRGVDAADLTMRELGGAPVLLHVEAQEGGLVVEHAVVVRVAVDRSAGRAVAVVRGGVVAEVGRIGARDGGVDRIGAAREVDGVEGGER